MEKRKNVVCVVLVALALLLLLGQWGAAHHRRSRHRSWDALIAHAHGDRKPHGVGDGGAQAASAPHAMADLLLERLVITGKQEAQFQPLRRRFDRELESITRDRTLTSERRHELMMGAWVRMLDAMDPDLTPEQQDMARRLQAMIRKRMPAWQGKSR